MLSNLLSLKYPLSHASDYLDELNSIRQIHYPTITLYLLALNYNLIRLALCRKEDPSNQIEKLYELFWNGLSKESKRKMIELGVTAAEKMYDLIKRIELSIIGELTKELRSSIVRPKTNPQKDNRKPNYSKGSYFGNSNPKTEYKKSQGSYKKATIRIPRRNPRPSVRIMDSAFTQLSSAVRTRKKTRIRLRRSIRTITSPKFFPLPFRPLTARTSLPSPL